MTLLKVPAPVALSQELLLSTCACLSEQLSAGYAAQ